MKILLKNAKILKMIDENINEGHVVIEDNIIKKVGSDVDLNDTYDQIIDCEGNLLMPSFKNAHTHSGMTFLRSIADDSNLQDWLFKEIFPREDNLREGHIRELVKVAFLEYIAGGISVCLDQYFYIDEFKETCEKMNFRSVSIAMYNKESRPVDMILDYYNSWNTKDALAKMVVGLHAEYTANDDMLEKTQELIQKTKSPFYTHLDETYHEVKECEEKRGMSPLEFLDSLHLFDYGGAVFHGVYLNDKEIEILKKRNIVMVSCPASNMKLASGIANITKLLKEGVTVALGTDGPASNNSLDMFREMYLVTGLQKILNKDPVSIPAFEVLKMATVNGAIAMNLDNAKYLDEGQLADIIMIDLSRPQMQPINNIISNLVYSGSKDIIKMTMINGKVVYMDNKFYVDEDVNDIYRKVQEMTNDLIKIKSKD